MPAIPSLEVTAMVERLLREGGVLRIPAPSPAERARWRRTIHAAINQGGLPDGTRLRHTGRNHGDLVIRLVDDTTANEPRKPDPPRVPVPTRIPGRPHPLVTATRDAATPVDGWVDTRRTPGVAHISVAKASASRALCVFHGLYAEAERRGYTITVTGPNRTCAGGSAVVIDGHVLEVVIAEERTRVPHRLTPVEQARPAEYRWAPRWDYVASGRLVLRLGHDYYGPPLATDRTRWRIEDRLGRAFERLEAAAADAEARRQERIRSEQEHQARLEAERERQERDRRGAQRVEHLTRQVAAWRLAADIHAFVGQARVVVEPNDAAAAAWLDWAVAYAESIDPLRHPIAFPDGLAPTDGAHDTPQRPTTWRT